MGGDLIGKYVIVRCTGAGVHAGVLQSRNGSECILTEARRLWYWVPAGNQKWLSGVATHGLDASSKIGNAINVLLTEICEIIETTEAAELSIRGIKSDER